MTSAKRDLYFSFSLCMTQRAHSNTQVRCALKAGKVPWSRYSMSQLFSRGVIYFLQIWEVYSQRSVIGINKNTQGLSSTFMVPLYFISFHIPYPKNRSPYLSRV